MVVAHSSGIKLGTCGLGGRTAPLTLCHFCLAGPITVGIRGQHSPPPPLPTPTETSADSTAPGPLRTAEVGSASPPTVRSPSAHDYDARLPQLLRWSVPDPLIREPVPLLRTLTVRPGDTLISMATSVYGEASPLVLDRVLSVNPALKDIDRIIIGQVMVFPEISPASLVRRIANGHHIIHAVTVSSAAKAAELQAKISQQGYTVSVLPVPVSASQQWFRVLVGEFDAPEGALRFWRSMKW